MADEAHHRRIWNHVRWGVLVGVALAAFYSLWVAVLAVGMGAEGFRREHGISPWTLAAAYFAGGVVGGAIAGACGTVLRGWPGAMVTGVLAALPLFFSFHLSDHGTVDWRSLSDVWTVSLIIGAPGGVVTYAIWRKIDPLGPLD